MIGILTSLIGELINGYIGLLDQLMLQTVDKAFYIEKSLTSSLGNIDFSKLTIIFLMFGIALITLKYVNKLGEIYIFWENGDVDQDPTTLLKKYIKALALAISFPILYALLTMITRELLESAMSALPSVGSFSMGDLFESLSSLGLSVVVSSLVYAICGLVLLVQFSIRGVQIWIMRTGFPIACTGLLDEDGGAFTPYSKKFIQNALTVLVQIVLVKLGLIVILADVQNITISIVILIAAIITPKFLQEFMITSGGGVNMNSISAGARAANSLKSLLRR